MCRYFTFLTLIVLIGTVSSAVSKPPKTDHKSRVIDDDLSKSPHDVHGEHNPKYDRDALFGGQGDEVDNLTPEEAKKKIESVFDRMDVDTDGHVTSTELLDWLRKVHQNASMVDTKRIWADHGLELTDKLTWKQYEDHAKGEDGEYEGEDEETRKAYIQRDKQRWDLADKDHDGVLSLSEASVFFNPEAHAEMHDLLVKETIEELDKNKDGFIDMKEYIDDIWKPSGNEPEPDWVKTEREEFHEKRDLDHDGKLDEKEVKNWIFPPGYDHSEAEVKHLMSECDTDKDGRLSKEEMRNRHDLLVSSAATNYGEIFTDHDEL